MRGPPTENWVVSWEWGTEMIWKRMLSQISYSLIVILELSDVLEVQYKEIMMSSINKNN